LLRQLLSKKPMRSIFGLQVRPKVGRFQFVGSGSGAGKNRTPAGARKRRGRFFENVAFPDFEKRSSISARKKGNGGLKVVRFLRIDSKKISFAVGFGDFCIY
jgi:hypothetical protein